MAHPLLQLTTRRLNLVAATPALARAEARDRGRLPALLGAAIPPSWPPPLNDAASVEWTLRLLEADPGAVGWATWYFIARVEGRVEGRTRTLVGNGGFYGRPAADGTAEVGYSILVEHQRQGCAPEAVEALVVWAFLQPGVRRVIATTLPDLRPSIRVLEKTGFRPLGPGPEKGTIRFERLREP